MTPRHESDPLLRLLQQAYAAPPPGEQYVQSLGQRLQQELTVARSAALSGRPQRQWRKLGLAVAASVLVGALVALIASLRGPDGSGQPTTPAVIRRDPEKSPQTIKEDIRPTR